MKTLITMPNYDDATSYLYYYAEELVKFAEEKNITVSQLKRPRLRRKILEESITKQNPQLLLFNAHGDETTIYGDKVEGEEEYLIREKENHQLLTGRLTYARACSAAASLGKACTQKDGCFIGYNQPFSFWTDTSRTTTPLKWRNFSSSLLMNWQSLSFAGRVRVKRQILFSICLRKIFSIFLQSRMSREQWLLQCFSGTI